MTRGSLLGACTLGVLLLGLALDPKLATLGAADPVSEDYKPLASAKAIHLAMQGHLKVTREWLLDKDYPSAQESTQGFAALTQMLSHQYASTEGQAKVKELRETISSLASNIRQKNATESKKALAHCNEILEGLASLPAERKERLAIKSFKPAGSTKTWMTLMDASYVDAKAAKESGPMELLAQALAEEANATAFLRTDARWRQFSHDVRDLALDAARTARANDLEGARQTLKKAYSRCEACHQGYKR